MKTSVENTSSLGRKLKVQVTATAVTHTFDKVFKKIQRDAHLKGFRPGKAPIATIRTVYGDQAKQDVAQSLIYEHYPVAIKDNSLSPINYPEFEFDPPSESQDFTFSAHFEIRPEVPLKKYEGLEIEKEIFKTEDKKVEEVIQNILQSHAEWIDLLIARPAQMGDLAVVDFEGFIDGAPLEQGKGTGFHLELGSNRFIPGFEEGLVGMNIGGTKRLSLKFPDQYQAEHLSGKPVEFDVVLQNLKKKSLPEITPEFLKEKLGGIESIEKLKENIAKDIERSETKRIENDLKNRLLKTLVKNNPFEVPVSLVNEQKDVLVADMKERFVAQGMPDSQFEDYRQKWDKDFEATAQEIVKSSFLVDAIAAKHELQWSQEDFDKRLTEYSQQTGIEIDKVRDFYSKPEQSQKLAYMITEEKVISLILQSAKLNMVEKDKLKTEGA